MGPRNRSDYFEAAVTLASLLNGAVYLFGPDRLRSADSFAYLNSLGSDTQPMQVWGGIIFLAALFIIVGRLLHTRPTRLIRIGHALGAGAFFFMGLATLLAVFDESRNGGTWVHQWIVAAMHFFYATDEPSLSEVSEKLQKRRD